MKPLQRMLQEARVFFAAPRQQRERILFLFGLYRSLDRNVRRFQQATGLRCAAGCGQCCENPEVETTVLELLPLAVDLWQRRQAEEVLLKLAHVTTETQCLLYQPSGSASSPGHCGNYFLRPTICRFFGFASRADKNGSAQLVTCATIKDQFLKAFPQEETRKQQESQAPRMADYAYRLSLMDAVLGQERLPINHALKEALERVGFEYKMQKKIS